MIKVDEIYACNDEDLLAELNKIVGRIISIDYNSDDFYKVIYDYDEKGGDNYLSK